ncbi:hypothetical protein EYF80_011222 [Liparis tanakae]|uniref:Uncharacterized protein n=1 Tax=Liparis tanakae TaxID=230148 RepID=A0A4Z2ILI7_9TELE|nr:hypothetical protein EYF80_011222 [Liparis tanakae]
MCEGKPCGGKKKIVCGRRLCLLCFVVTGLTAICHSVRRIGTQQSPPPSHAVVHQVEKLMKISVNLLAPSISSHVERINVNKVIIPMSQTPRHLERVAGLCRHWKIRCIGALERRAPRRHCQAGFLITRPYESDIHWFDLHL